MQKVHLEVAAVALAAQDVAQLLHHLARRVRLVRRKYLAPDVIAAPAAPVRSQLRITNEIVIAGPITVPWRVTAPSMRTSTLRIRS